MNVVWTKEAQADLSAWLDYMADRNPIAGEQVVSLVLSEVERIAKMPLIGRNSEVFGAREWKVNGTPLRIVYCILDELIHILFIPHDRQKWPRNH